MSYSYHVFAVLILRTRIAAHSSRLAFGSQLPSCFLRWTRLSPRRSATSPRCSRTATRTQPTSSSSRCKTRRPPQQPLTLDSKPLLHCPSVSVSRITGRKQALRFYYLLIFAFDSCAVTQVDAWTWINIQISNVFSLDTLITTLHE